MSDTDTMHVAAIDPGTGQVIEGGTIEEVLAKILGTGAVPAQVRHTTFADPPGGMTAQEYEDALRGLAAEAPAEQALFQALLYSLGMDNVKAHGVDRMTTFEAILKFAHELWEHAHPEGEQAEQADPNATAGPYL